MTTETDARRDVLGFFPQVPEGTLLREKTLAALDAYRDAVLRDAAKLVRTRSEEYLAREKAAHGGVDHESVVMHEGAAWAVALFDPDIRKV